MGGFERNGKLCNVVALCRSWRNDLPKGACVIVETSVEHPDAPVMPGGTRGIVLASRYLIEPCGSGKSRIMHLSRVDTKYVQRFEFEMKRKNRTIPRETLHRRNSIFICKP